jgi:predicted dehydrogenase
MTDELDLDLDYKPRLDHKTDYAIGAIGAGFIMRDVQLRAYQEAGFKVVALASRTREHAEAVAREYGIPRVHSDWQRLLADPEVEIVDIAYPPHLQLEIVREAVGHADHIRGILAQKPVAANLSDAQEMVRLCNECGITLAVNQNMRYDQAMRALKTLLVRGDLGEPLVAHIVMNVKPSWQSFLHDYGRLEILNMSVHHMDCFRYLFGEPERVVASAAPDPTTTIPHKDGMAVYVLEYASGLRAIAVENTAATMEWNITWRVDGSKGMARGTIGWPDYPDGSPSRIAYRTWRRPGYLFCPEWKERWFPQAFIGTMGQLMRAVDLGSEPEISGKDNLKTMAVIEAAYRSVEERRSVELTEFALATQNA